MSLNQAADNEYGQGDVEEMCQHYATVRTLV